MQNRSAPPGIVIPWLPCANVDQAIRWLTGAFGFQERFRTPPAPDGSIHHAQVLVGDAAIVLTARAPQAPAPSQTFLVRVPDVDAHYQRARDFGARIVSPPRTAEFGERQYTAEDPEGFRWTFSQSVADVDPVSWGALMAPLDTPNP